MSGRGYGFFTWADLFTDRQLVALTTFSDLVSEARERIRFDAVSAGLPDDGVPLREGGIGATAYAEAVGVYLAFGKQPSEARTYAITLLHLGAKFRRLLVAGHLFTRQAIPMMWDLCGSKSYVSQMQQFWIQIGQLRLARNPVECVTSLPLE